ncbi:rRNA maturation RNase YbeY [Oceanotoga sp. DSM 15011]|jgi:probable rRNA maturation factor|uniref:Endoribonuclease YbeY n=1 Tax=Oceanotoga teriensis TaxID=515440 RepID=A0AA45C8Q6_9BACT|nr:MULTISPECIES: rRNA maturation RNase YbeY [Oceanotoga]MDN5342421.1 putative rRNA maturation factor [Oceanotoga sp.]MDO7975498.1 rRNA maturation RNase YbeY [Oceanotoga teriensis]PWJ96214.1 putative rRNA maturation factor [Oceanotoga teriensis]UYO99997.1 rRNA maturation RNase YbeY [Oceanotoga sp. DSM 15011]
MIVNINNEQNEFEINEAKMIEIVKKVIISEYKDDNFEINILITNNKRITEYNENFRKKSGPTDVLSFEYGLNEPVIGDIVISSEKIYEQSKEFNNSFNNELYYILIHGVLHILGYDHIYDESEAEEMFEIQKKYFNLLKEEG